MHGFYSKIRQCSCKIEFGACHWEGGFLLMIWKKNSLILEGFGSQNVMGMLILLQNWPKSLRNPSKIEPRALPNQSWKTYRFLKRPLEGSSLWFYIFSSILEAFSEPKCAPKSLKKRCKNQHRFFARILWFLDDFGSHFGVDFYEFSSRRQKWPTCVSTAPAWSDRGSDLSKSSQTRARRESKSRLRFAIIFFWILSTFWLNFGDQNGAKMWWKSESKSSSTKNGKKCKKVIYPGMWGRSGGMSGPGRQSLCRQDGGSALEKLQILREASEVS